MAERSNSETLRPYQIAAVESVLALWRQKKKRLLVAMATGTGKTVLFAEIAKRCKGNVIIVNERQELVEQTRDKLKWWTGEPVGIEMADRRDLSRGPRPRIVCASIQTLAKRFTRVPFQWPTLIIIDEAHHAVAKSYRDVIDYFAPRFMLGVTATPDRTDDIFLGQVFEDVAFEYSVAAAIRDGFLAPIRQFIVKTSIDFSKVRTIAGDLAAGDLEALMLHENALAEIAKPTLDESKGKPGIAFCVTVRHAHDLAKAINAMHGGTIAAALDGSHSREERAEVLGAARRGDLKILCNCALFTEGFDWPAIETVAMARPTKSRALYAQMLGRGTRLSPGKTDVLALDFAGISKRHRLVRAIDIFEGEVAEDELDVASEIVEEHAEALTLDELLSLSRERIAEKRHSVRYEMIRQDPFVQSLLEGATFTDAPATPEQIKALLTLGIVPETASLLTQSAAALLIGRLEDRKAGGLCTAPQAKLLRRHGLDSMNITKQQAAALIAGIRRNGWKVTGRAAC